MPRVTWFYLLACLPLIMLAAANAANAQRTFETDILRDTFGFDGLTERSVDLEDLVQGCPARDCIPSIDDPVFVQASQARHVADDAVVIALSWNSEQRAYPARILDQHEIVNDVIAGTPIAITWCPLCGSAVGLLRRVGGQVTEFGVSGVLHNSDLVLYDRATETLWDQIRAEGIVGPLTGEKLQLVPVTMTRWSKWKAAHPETLVLSDELGTGRDYTRDHYGTYRQEERLMFPVSRESDTVHPKTVVFGFDLGDRKVAFTESILDEVIDYVYRPGGQELTVSLAGDGSVRMRNNATGETWTPVRLYWFAWYTFHPETELVGE